MLGSEPRGPGDCITWSLWREATLFIIELV